MGRRSRKRAETPVSPLADAPAPPAPRRAPTAPRLRARSEERPPAPWGDFPLGELTTFAGIVLMVIGFATSTFKLMALGFSLVALAAVELTIREHFAGFRSHSSLLALVAAALFGAVLIVLHVPRVVQVVVAAGVL